MSGMTVGLMGIRVLVVEDSFLVAAHMKDVLEEHGCVVIGPVGRLAEGLSLASQSQLDCALLDIDLHGERSFPIAKALQERGVPFVFLTGNAAEDLPAEIRGASIVSKPIGDTDLLRLVSRICAR